MEQLQKEPYYKRHFRKIIAFYYIMAIINITVAWRAQPTKMYPRIIIISAVCFFLLFIEAKALQRLYHRYSHNTHDILKAFGILATLILVAMVPATLNFKSADSLFSSQAQAFGKGLDVGLEYFWIFIFAEIYLNRWNYRIWAYAVYWVILLILRTVYSKMNSEDIIFYIRVGLYTSTAFFLEMRSRSNNSKSPSKVEPRREVREFLDQLNEDVIIFGASLQIKYCNLSELARSSRERILSPGETLLDILSQKPEVGPANMLVLTNLGSPRNPGSVTERRMLIPTQTGGGTLTDSGIKTDPLTLPITLLENIRCLPVTGFSKMKMSFPGLSAAVENSQSCSFFLNSVTSDPSLLEELQSSKQKFTFKGYLPKSELNEDIYFELHLSAVKFENEDAWALIIKDETQMINQYKESNQMHINVLNSVSHELRTPLNCSLNVLEEALISEKINQEIRENFIVPALTNTKLLSYFVDDIMCYLHIQRQAIKITPRRKSLNQTLYNCANMVQYSLKRRNLQLKVEIEYTGELFFTTDHHKLSQIVLNLLVNAVKFTFNGEITLGLKLSSIDEILIYVQDTGIGLSAKEMERLKGKVSQGNFGININDKGTGAGLGLIISNSLLSFLSPTRKEKIQIESAKGKGSTFSFVIQDLSKCMILAELQENPGVELDVIDNSVDISITNDQISNGYKMNDYQMNPRPSSLSHISQTSREYKPHEIDLQITCKCPPILVVDDDCFNIVTIENMLKSLGKTCDIAFNGELAIKKIQDRHLSPCSEACQVYSLIIMDCNMPIMDGYEATRFITEKIKQRVWKKMMIVGCTAYVGKEKLDKCLESGMDSYIHKPIIKDNIRELVKYIKN
mgnify:FL=1